MQSVMYNYQTGKYSEVRDCLGTYLNLLGKQMGVICTIKDTATDEKQYFVDLEIFEFLDTLRCIVQFQLKLSLFL